MIYTKSDDTYNCPDCGHIFAVGNKAQERVVSVSVLRLCLNAIQMRMRAVLRAVKGVFA